MKQINLTKAIFVFKFVNRFFLDRSFSICKVRSVTYFMDDPGCVHEACVALRCGEVGEKVKCNATFQVQKIALPTGGRGNWNLYDTLSQKTDIIRGERFFIFSCEGERSDRCVARWKGDETPKKCVKLVGLLHNEADFHLKIFFLLEKPRKSTVWYDKLDILRSDTFSFIIWFKNSKF